MPKYPKGLKAAGRRFWREVFTTYYLTASPEEMFLVEEAARTADVVARLQGAVDTAQSLRTRGSRGQDVAIPELDALRAYRAQFAALLKQLDFPAPLDEGTADESNNGPMSRSAAGKAGAAARWGNRKASSGIPKVPPYRRQRPRTTRNPARGRGTSPVYGRTVQAGSRLVRPTREQRAVPHNRQPPMRHLFPDQAWCRIQWPDIPEQARPEHLQ
ncbi:Uncharacterised protein [Mycobacteroides abscessus]|nr:Uncharacterised protein [Mycobacteroides abscessus]